MDVLEQLAAVVGVFVLCTLAIWSYQRSLDRPGGRDGLGTHGDAFNPINEIFHPAAHRATQELQRYDLKTEVAPSPDDDEDHPVRLVAGPDGRPAAVRLRGRGPSGSQVHL